MYVYRSVYVVPCVCVNLHSRLAMRVPPRRGKVPLLTLLHLGAKRERECLSLPLNGILLENEVG